MYFSCTAYHYAAADFFLYSALPNTVDDKNIEYIEVINTSSSSGSLDGYILSDKSGKEYIILDTILGPSEKRKFYRPDTRLILNNSREEIYLKTATGGVIDEVEYESSVKGEEIIFLDIQQPAISDESYLQIWYSDEATIDEHTQENTEKIMVPDIAWEFQQPSYIGEKDIIQDTYTCDMEKDTCKINFNFLSSFIDGTSASDYTCQTSFGFVSGQENRCNPNTITFPEGEFQVSIKIISKEDTSQYKQRNISIKNIRPTTQEDIEPENSDKETQNSEKGTEEENPEQNISDEKKDSSGDTEEESDVTEVLTAPDIDISWQQPSYVLLDSDDIYQCDTSRETCKINIDLRDSFAEGFSASDYICHNTFGFETGYENSCNPGTINLPVGTHRFEFNIIHDKDNSVLTTEIITINNQGYIPSTKKKTTSLPKFFLDIDSPVIRVQSGLHPGYRKYICKGEKCRVNLEYKKQDKDERCLWNFGNGEYKDSTTRRCNPGYIDYPAGRHSITLRVYQKGNETNYRETRIAFDTEPGVILPAESLLEQAIIEDTQKDIEKEMSNAQILVQGKIGKNKVLQEKSITCTTKDTCSINFDSGPVSGGDISYVWDFGDASTSQRQNPLSKKYHHGEYEVVLVVYSGDSIIAQDNFLVSVIFPPEKTKSLQESKGEIQHIFTGSLQISQILINPVGNDIREWIEIENVGSATSLETCHIQRGKKKYYFTDEEILSQGKTRKIFRVFSKITLPNTQGEISLYCSESLQDTLSWDIKVGEGRILTREKNQFVENYAVSRNDFISDASYAEFIDKSYYMNVRILKGGVKISGGTLSEVKLNITSSQGHSFDVVTDTDGVFEVLLDTGFYSGDLFVYVDFLDELGLNHRFEGKKLLLTHQDIVNFGAKYIKKKKKVTQKKDIPKELTITKMEYIAEEELSITEKLLFTFLLLCITFIGSIYVFYISLNGTSLGMTSMYRLSFKTKHRTLLILS